MRQRPKQAGYVEKMEAQMPNRVPRQVTSSNNVTSAAQAKRLNRPRGLPDVGGRMTKYISLDDIPDGIPTSPPEADQYLTPIEHSASQCNRDASNEASYHTTYTAEVTCSAPKDKFSDFSKPDQISFQQYLPSNGVIRSSPICTPGERGTYSEGEEDDDWHNAEDVAEYRSPTLKQKAQRHEAEKHKSFLQANFIDNTHSTKQGPASSKEKSNSSATSGKDGLYYSRNPRKVEYRPYTLDQYKSIKSESYVEYGKLKPDLNTEELKAKRANAERVKEFSKNLNSFNKQQIREAATENCSNLSDRQTKAAEPKSSRDRAKEFSKLIPKPRVQRTPVVQGPLKQHTESNDGYGTAAEEYCISTDHEINLLGIPNNAIGGNSRLQELQMKHGENKKKVDAIKKSLGLAL